MQVKSIKAKLVITICALFILTGALICVPLSNILPKKITAQILKRDAEIAKYLSGAAEGHLLLDDRIALSLLLHDNLDKLEDAQYLFIRGAGGDIIAHTFTGGFPRALLHFGKTALPYSIKGFLREGARMYDIAVPIMGGELGTLHMGVSLQSGRRDIAEIAKINYYVAIIILIGLAAGVLAFSGMARRLKKNMAEIKRLNTIEERNRIAIDLHDSSAQDLANIIKRVELCERLFKADPQKAFAELYSLRENTKAVLDRTRGVIFDLKSPGEEADFRLVPRLTDYIKEYRQHNNIDVRLDISGPLNLPPDKSKSIFYIIAEALTNARKHSLAKNVKVALEPDNNHGLNIKIEDDGKGFDVSGAALSASKNNRWGLVNMRQRSEYMGADFFITSRVGEGAKISIKVPLTRQEFSQAKDASGRAQDV